MASPKVSLQQRRYQGQWNMRSPSDGEIPRENLNTQRLNIWRLPGNIQTCIVCSTIRLKDMDVQPSNKKSVFGVYEMFPNPQIKMWTSKNNRITKQLASKWIPKYWTYTKVNTTLHHEPEMYEIWSSWPVQNFHGSDAATHGNGIWGCPLTDNTHERANFQWKFSTSEGLIYDVCFGICRHYRLLLQQKLESLAALPSNKFQR